MGKTNITIEESTLEKLEKVRYPDETFDETLNRVIKGVSGEYPFINKPIAFNVEQYDNASYDTPKIFHVSWIDLYESEVGDSWGFDDYPEDGHFEFAKVVYKDEDMCLIKFTTYVTTVYDNFKEKNSEVLNFSFIK